MLQSYAKVKHSPASRSYAAVYMAETGAASPTP
jgi:hypothetical protein